LVFDTVATPLYQRDRRPDERGVRVGVCARGQAAVSTQGGRVVLHSIARRAYKGVALVLPLDEGDAEEVEMDAPAEGMDVDSR